MAKGLAPASSPEMAVGRQWGAGSKQEDSRQTHKSPHGGIIGPEPSMLATVSSSERLRPKNARCDAGSGRPRVGRKEAPGGGVAKAALEIGQPKLRDAQAWTVARQGGPVHANQPSAPRPTVHGS